MKENITVTLNEVQLRALFWLANYATGESLRKQITDYYSQESVYVRPAATKAIEFVSTHAEHSIYTLLQTVCINNNIREDSDFELPPELIKIANHTVSFNSDGSLQVGCTRVERSTVETIYKRMFNEKPKTKKYIAYSSNRKNNNRQDPYWKNAGSDWATKEEADRFDSKEEAQAMIDNFCTINNMDEDYRSDVLIEEISE